MPQPAGQVTEFYDKMACAARLTRKLPSLLLQGLQMYSRSLNIATVPVNMAHVGARLAVPGFAFDLSVYARTC
jgi:hypothetical protein